MENQRTEYIQAKEYERTENRQSQRNGYYERALRRVGTLELKVPRTRDGHFHPQCLNVINETKKPSWLQCWKCMYQAFQLVKYQKLWKNFVVNPSLSPSFLA